MTQKIYQGQSWKDLPSQKKEIFDVFLMVFQFFQIRYFLAEAMSVCTQPELEKEIQKRLNENQNLCRLSPDELKAYPIEGYRGQINILLKKVCGWLQQKKQGSSKKKECEKKSKTEKRRGVAK